MATSRSLDDGDDSYRGLRREERATCRLRWPVAGRQEGFLARVLRLVLRSLEKRGISRGFWGPCLDSKSGAGQPVEGSNPLPSASHCLALTRARCATRKELGLVPFLGGGLSSWHPVAWSGTK